VIRGVGVGVDMAAGRLANGPLYIGIGCRHHPTFFAPFSPSLHQIDLNLHLLGKAASVLTHYWHSIAQPAGV
jgi:hypothetical protein